MSTSRKIMVTGGAGFIGSQTCKQLAEVGFIPVGFDNLERGTERFLRYGPWQRGDLRNPDDLERFFSEHAVAAIIHFAGYIEAGISYHDPLPFYANNVTGSINLLSAALRHGVKRILFSSTAAVYGGESAAPIREDAALAPQSPYGETKLMVERLLRDARRGHDLNYICLRYFNAAGADSNAELGELHRPETHLIPLVLQAAAGLRERIQVFGTDYPTRDGSCIRDYVHVEDLAAAHLLALNQLLTREPHELPAREFNLGNGAGYSVLEVIATARQVVGREIPFELAARRPGDPAKLVADSTRARTLLGWQPRRAALETIIEDAWRFLRSTHQ